MRYFTSTYFESQLVLMFVGINMSADDDDDDALYYDHVPTADKKAARVHGHRKASFRDFAGFCFLLMGQLYFESLHTLVCMRMFMVSYLAFVHCL